MADIPTDAEFLAALIQLTDQYPTAKIGATEVLGALEAGVADGEPFVRRLKRRGLINWAPGPKRMADGWDAALVVTPDGYNHGQDSNR